MAQRNDPHQNSYPTGRGYGHDYLRGGEVFGGYGYSARPGYQRQRGDESVQADVTSAGQKVDAQPTGQRPRTLRDTDQPSPEHPLNAS